MALPDVLLPGEYVDQAELADRQQSKSSKSLTLGPGLQFKPPSQVVASATGVLNADARKTALWLETNGCGHYLPMTGDQVIAVVHHSSTDAFICSLSPHTLFANLGHLSFEGANRKTRPQLQHGSLVYARVTQALKHLEPEIECVHPSTGKSDGMGELKGGMLFDMSLGMARRMLMAKKDESGVVILDELGEQNRLRFEVAVGRNGKVWINSDSVKTTIAIGRALQETDQRGLTVKDQQKLVKRLMREP